LLSDYCKSTVQRSKKSVIFYFDIHNMGLFSEAKHLHKQLEPIAKALDKLQSDSSSIADACEIG